MARAELSITRRQLLKSGLAAGAGGAVGAGALGGAPASAATAGDPWYRTGEIRTTYNVCDMCPWHCGIVVHTVDGEIRKIDGNPNDPKARGQLCPRGQGGISFMNDPDRLQAPMVRTGERGEGKFQEVSWDEALDLIAQGLNQIKERSGPESVAVFGHNAGDWWWADHFAQAWGTPNAAKPSSALCISAREEAAELTFGFPIGGYEPVDWDELQCVTLIGTHIGEDARNTKMQDLANLHGRGGTIITVDPRFSSAATKADHGLPIKPGTDTALLLAWMHVIIEEEAYNADFIEKWTTGFDRLVEHVADKTPEWAAEITDLPAEQIRETALEMAANAPQALIVPGRHVAWYGTDTQRMRAVYLINVLMGSYGCEGCLHFNTAPYIDDYSLPPYQVEGSAGGCAAEPDEDDDGPLGDLPEGPTGKARADGVQESFLQGPTALQELIEPMITGDPYPIEGLICYGTNLFHSVPMVERTKEAVQNLELFVAIDVLPMEHIAYADVVLPEATYLERHDDLYALAHKTPYIALREPAVSPMYDTRPGWWIAKALGERVGLEQYFPWDGIEDYLNTRLRSIGSDLDDLRARGGIIVQEGKPFFEDFDGESPFLTDSGKVELYSSVLEETGHDPLPEYEPPDEAPEGYFRLLYGRHPVHTFAKTQNTPALSKRYPENELWLNASQAADLGLSDGQRVMLENQDGVTDGPIKLKVTERIRPDSVYMVHGFGHRSDGLSRAGGQGASDNRLQSSYTLDPISGSAGLRNNFVRIASEA